jgi:hypothetical protein
MGFKLNRRAALVCVCALVAAAVIAFVIFTRWDASGEGVSEEWVYLDEGYYALMNTAGGAHILIRRPWGGDSQDVNETLAGEGETSDVFMVKDGEITADGVSEAEISSELTDAAHIDVRRILTPNHSMVLPRSFGGSTGIPFAIAAGGEFVLFMSDSGMTYIDSQGEVKALSSPVYNGKTYDQLQEEAVRLPGGYVFWNGQVSVSPDNACAAYVSNKGDVGGAWDLYVLDIQSGVETLLKDDAKMRYGVLQWADRDHIICDKAYDGEYSLVIVNKDGREYDVDFLVDRPVLLGAKDGVIAYSDENCGAIYFARFTGSGTLAPAGRYDLEGTFRIRPGIDPFSPDGSKFAYLFVPADDPLGRRLAVVELDAFTQVNHESVPMGTESGYSVLEFAWLDHAALFVSVMENETQAVSSWLCRLP